MKRITILACLAPLALAACDPAAPAPEGLPDDPQPDCIKDQPCEQPR